MKQKKGIVYDEDAPKLSEAMKKAFECASERKRQIRT